ncbi:hypothetical protein Chor_001979 [Crotalus horridus]
MNLLLGSLLLAGVCRLGAIRDIPIVPNFDNQRIAKTWYPLASIPTGQTVTVAFPQFQFVAQPNGNLKYRIRVPQNGICRTEEIMLRKEGRPGYYVSNAPSTVRFVETDYNTYFIAHLTRGARKLDTFLALAGTQPNLTRALREKLKTVAISLGIIPEIVNSVQLEAGRGCQSDDSCFAGKCRLTWMIKAPGAPRNSQSQRRATLSCLPFCPGARSCKELLSQGVVLSGWHTTYPQDCRPLRVLCDMHTDGGRWIVFQDDSVDFFQDWAAYKRGFGSELSAFWLGNDHLHLLTSLGKYELRIDFMDFENRHSFAKYGSFQVAVEHDQYRLTLGNFLGGPAGDSLSYHNHMPFSTREKQQDTPKLNCAEKRKGAWGYNECHDSNLNGQYWLGAHQSYADGINWRTGKGFHYSYKRTEMKIRPVA